MTLAAIWRFGAFSSSLSSSDDEASFALGRGRFLPFPPVGRNLAFGGGTAGSAIDGGTGDGVAMGGGWSEEGGRGVEERRRLAKSSSQPLLPFPFFLRP